MAHLARINILDLPSFHSIITRVWRSSDQRTGKPVAIKVISRTQAESCPNYNIKKEVLIHENLRHPNVIRLLEARKDSEYFYLVMEWAAGGELFEKIEPDVGFPEDVAHLYFVQLLSVLVHHDIV